MSAYSYRAVDTAGRPQKGVVEATSPSGARRALRELRLLPVSIEAAGAQRTQGLNLQFDVGAMFRPRVGAKKLAEVTRQLSTLIGSDVRIEEALRIVADQKGAGAIREVLLTLRGAVLEGRGFASALADHPDVFPEFYRASIAAGEHSGKLADVLAHLTEFVESRERARQKVQLALLYPTLLAAVSGGIIVLLLVYVVPDIVRVFVSRGAELPFLTRALIAISGGVQKFGWVMALVALGLGIATRQWLAVADNRMAVARFVALTPPLARFSQQISGARFAGSLATLVQSNVPLVDALSAAAAVTPNRYIRAQAIGVAARVREGTSLHRAMNEADCFPPMLLAIVASGESSGRLGPTLGRAAADMDREVEALVTALVALVEPGVLLLMGGIVLLLVLSILLPIVNLSNLAGM